MNKARRKMIYDARFHLELVYRILEDVKNQEEEAHENLPESLMYSDRASDMEENIEALEDALETIDEVYDNLKEIAAEKK